MSKRFLAVFSAVFLFVTGAHAASLDEATKAVEHIRGRKFLLPVREVAIDRAELPVQLREQMAKSLPYSIDEWVTILQSLQLVDRDTKDVVPKLISLYESQVLAFYDAQTHTYFSIRQLPAAAQELDGGAMLEETVVVHELTHALQDQLFGIGEKDFALRADTDASLAYHALLEGEASLVMLAHVIEKGGADFDALVKQDALVNAFMAAAGADKSIDSSTPRYFAESLKFPYIDGLRFVIEAYRRGGWKELDRVHADPPRSSREILHPEDYFEKKFRAKAFDAKLPAKALTVEHLGEYHWGYMVGKENAVGWLDDRVVITMNDLCEPLVSVETTWESRERANTFRDAYVAFLRGRGIEPGVEQQGAVVKVRYAPV